MHTELHSHSVCPLLHVRRYSACLLVYTSGQILDIGRSGCHIRFVCRLLSCIPYLVVLADLQSFPEMLYSSTKKDQLYLSRTRTLPAGSTLFISLSCEKGSAALVRSSMVFVLTTHETAFSTIHATTGPAENKSLPRRGGSNTGHLAAGFQDTSLPLIILI